MTWYVILFFAATLTGMAISVAVFGTGGKRKRVFRDIYSCFRHFLGLNNLSPKNQ